MRNITIISCFTTISEHAQSLIDAKNAVHPGPEIERAIGYLSTWSLSGFSHVELTVDPDGDITATYRKEAGGPIGYCIGAVWNGERFGFHS